MNQYHRLTQHERYVIETMRRNDFTLSEIAKMLNRSVSTVTREIERNLQNDGRYSWAYAHRQSRHRLKVSHRHTRITHKHWQCIEACLREQHSPEQIAGRLKTKTHFSISPERIYQYVAEDAKSGGDLYTNLRQRKKVRRPRGRKSEDRRGQIRNRVSITERPSIVDERSRVGDWEVDTIVSRESKDVLVTAVERTTLATIIERVSCKEADAVARALIRRLSPLQEWVQTLTGDNGKEFAGHQKVAAKLSASFYFAQPYHSWERGTNENTNGLIRQYFPKKTDFALLSKKEIKMVEQKINSRPRKSLGYLSASEYFLEKTGLPLPAGRGRCVDVNKLYSNCTFAIAA